MYSVERKQAEVTGLPPGWKIEKVTRKSGLSAGQTDVYYISPDGVKLRSKAQLVRVLGAGFDTSCLDFRTGRVVPGAARKPGIKHASKGPYDYAKSMRYDADLVLPIRQTASIFKQPVTVIRNGTKSKRKADLKHGPQEPPKVLFWEKRLQGLRACDISEEKAKTFDLPQNIKGVGPELDTANILQSIVAALHVNNRPITGQQTSRSVLQKNPGAHVNPQQPLIQSVMVSDQDIHKQEVRVVAARKRLEEAIASLQEP